MTDRELLRKARNLIQMCSLIDKSGQCDEMVATIHKHLTDTEDKIDYNRIIEDFHYHCPSLPKVKALTPKRKTAIKLRIKEFSLQELLDVFALTEASNFLSGRETYWKASFDWLINPTNFTKVLEGNYLNKGEASILDEQDGSPDGSKHFSITYRGAKVIPTSWKNGIPVHKNLAMDILLKKEFKK
tara:strand:- start:4635 stop:5192 length:558 start_codon:yes stop_codon:yes gene_type:complete